MTSIAEYMKTLTPEQRSENSRKTALALKKKKEDAKQIESSEKKMTCSKYKIIPKHELASILGRTPILKGIPVPPCRKNGLNSVYAPFFARFSLNQNVYFEDTVLGRRIYGAAQVYARKYEKTFVGRTEIVDGKKRFGIWRIK